MSARVFNFDGPGEVNSVLNDISNLYNRMTKESPEGGSYKAISNVFRKVAVQIAKDWKNIVLSEKDIENLIKTTTNTLNTNLDKLKKREIKPANERKTGPNQIG